MNAFNLFVSHESVENEKESGIVGPRSLFSSPLRA